MPIESSGPVLVVIGQIGAGKSTLCQNLVSLVGARHLDVADLRQDSIGDLDAHAIADLIASEASFGATVFECTGASPEFEEIVEQLRLRGLESLVVLLDCSIETAIRRVRGQPGRIEPRSGGTWADQMRWTESQLRLVPADVTILPDMSDPASVVNSVRQAWERAARKPRKISAPQEISFSKLVAFEVCPLSYELKYINGEPEVLETPLMYLGSRLHETLAWLYGRTSQHRSKSELIDWFEERLAESLPNGVSTNSVRDLIDTGRKALVFHYDVAYSNERRRTIAVEKRVRMSLGKGTTFVGRVDRIALDSSGTVEVIDYKTSPQRRNSRPRIPDGLQIAAYSVATLLDLGLSSVIARRTILTTGQEEQFALTSKDVRRVTLSLRRWLSRLTACRVFSPRVGAHCSSCQFNPICTAGRGFPTTPGAFVQ